MKNVIKAGRSRFDILMKALFYGVFRRCVPLLLTGVILSSLLISGCFWRRPEPPVAKNSKAAAVSPTGSDTHSASSVAKELPYGVRLQADPAVLAPFEFERVVDGDTIIVRDPSGNRLRVRLTGIDAPESVAEDASRNTEEGKAASGFLKELLKDTKTVCLEYDAERTDQYNRTLAYVWVRYEDTYVMVNEIILAAGHAKPVYIKPNLKYADDFRKYEK